MQTALWKELLLTVQAAFLFGFPEKKNDKNSNTPCSIDAAGGVD